MSEKTVERWVVDMKSQFDNFTPFIAARVEEALLKSIAETLRLQLANCTGDHKEASLEMPFGTIKADIRTKNDVDNVNVEVEFSKDFLKSLNGDIEHVWEEAYNDTFLTLFTDYVAYGFFNPNDDENRKRVETCNKCLRMRESEREFFPNSWTNMIIGIAKDKQRDGKTYTLDLDSVWDMGSITFEYKDDQIIPSFNASKVFKQYLKNGEITGTESADVSGTESTLDGMTKL